MTATKSRVKIRKKYLEERENNMIDSKAETLYSFNDRLAPKNKKVKK